MRPSMGDGDPDKEAKFTVLMDTSMPAILSENFFMTNYRECHEILMSESGRDRVAKIHFEMIQQLENEQ
jgi:N-acetylmuramoyl-L-alanine amidase